MIKSATTYTKVITALAYLGLMDASYLTFKYFDGSSILCTTGGCDIVTTSAYSMIFNMPVALLGAFFYLSVLLLGILHLAGHHSLIPKILPVLGLTGFLASATFVYLQIFVIEAICDFCMISAATSTLIFIFSLLLFFKSQRRILVG